MPTNTGKLLVQVLRKIPIFKGLSPSQVKKILGLCAHKSYKVGYELCRNNTPSDEMYILRSGELVVVTGEGIRVATILPVTTVGEMGVITGEPRSATVEVSKPSKGFVVKKRSFDEMLRNDSTVRATVYKNITDVLCDKLNNDNARMSDYQLEKKRSEVRVSALERQLLDEKRRSDTAIEMVAARGDMSAEKVATQIDEQIGYASPKVLVVDEANFRKLVSSALNSFTVVEASDGQEALAMVQEDELDLVITDIRMPNMDGFGLLQNLRAEFPLLPVVAVSSYLEDDDGRDHEFDEVIEKPFGVKDLRDLAEQMVTQKNNDSAG